MNDVSATSRTIDEAVSQLGFGPLTEESVQRHIAPLFSRVLANERIYLANHSLGRPLDAMAEDAREATSLWETKLGDAWGCLAGRTGSLSHSRCPTHPCSAC
jgi:kynureninase